MLSPQMVANSVWIPTFIVDTSSGREELSQLIDSTSQATVGNKKIINMCPGIFHFQD